jgi:hypothetical protein
MTLALPADVPILEGWNVWDVLQAQAPIDPVGTLDQQLGAWVREAMGDPDLPLALTSSAAAGELVTSRASIPELASEPSLGVAGSAVMRRTVAFESSGGRSIEWPQNDNLILDAVYHAAPAPGSAPVASRGAAAARVSQASMLPLALALALGLGLLLSRKRGTR